LQSRQASTHTGHMHTALLPSCLVHVRVPEQVEDADVELLDLEDDAAWAGEDEADEDVAPPAAAKRRLRRRPQRRPPTRQVWPRRACHMEQLGLPSRAYEANASSTWQGVALEASGAERLAGSGSAEEGAEEREAAARFREEERWRRRRAALKELLAP
jgi:hypothetical protein